MTLIELRKVNEDWQVRLRDVAVADADPTEVMPPVDDPPGWIEARVTAFAEFHRANRADPAKNTYAIVVDGKAAGAIRLDRIDADTLEIGYWVARSVRGQGIASEAIRLALVEAAVLGATRVVAETTTANLGSRRALAKNGATFTFDGDDIQATLDVPARLSSANAHTRERTVAAHRTHRTAAPRHHHPVVAGTRT